VTLAVTGNTISGRVVRRRVMQMSERHRLPLPEVDGTYGG
jgi:hypothetical protein